MDVNTGTRIELYLLGFPPPATWPAGVLGAINALNAEWKLALGPTAPPAAREDRRHGPAEALFQALDHLLYGRGASSAAAASLVTRLSAAEPSAPAANCVYFAYSARVAQQESAARNVPVLYVEYEQLDLSGLPAAVRRRLGVPGATLEAKIWQVDAANKKPLFHGELDMDHRALCKSLALGTAKLPALLRAALARRDRLAPLAGPAARPERPSMSAPQLLWRLLAAIGKRLFMRDQWQMETFVAAAGKTPADVTGHMITPPNSAFWADPFLVTIKNRLWLMFEALPYATGKGNISAMELSADGHAKSPPQVVLDEPWHLSYPFIYQELGQTYMIPDASMSRQLYLYRCGDDPLHWERLPALISDQSLADASLIRYQGRLWMFASHGDQGASMDDTLHIYVADQITGPWQAHSMNPVKVDARSSRPAGNMWLSDQGELYRVAQDCSTIYGGAAVCTRVLTLTEHEFEEQVIETWGQHYVAPGVPWHTYNRLDAVHVIDRLERRARWRTR